MRDNLVLLVGRLLLAWIFLHEGAFLLVNYSASSAAMAKMGTIALIGFGEAGMAFAGAWRADVRVSCRSTRSTAPFISACAPVARRKWRV